MSAHSTYLNVIVWLATATLITLAIAVAGSSGYLISVASVATSYLLVTGLGLFLLFFSLVLGAYNTIKALALLDCEQWNIRMVIKPTIVQIILLCAGVLFYLFSLLVI